MGINVQYQIPAALMKARRQREKRMYDRQVGLMRTQQAFNAQRADLDYQRRLKTLADNRDFQLQQMDRAREWKLEDRDYAEKAQGIQRQQRLDDLADNRDFQLQQMGRAREWKLEDLADERKYREKTLAEERKVRQLDKVDERNFKTDLMQMEFDQRQALEQERQNFTLQQQADTLLFQSEQKRQELEQVMSYAPSDETFLRKLDDEWMKVENNFRSGMFDESTYQRFYMDYARRRSLIMPKRPKAPEKTTEQLFGERSFMVDGKRFVMDSKGNFRDITNKSEVLSKEAKMKTIVENCIVPVYDKNGIQVGDEFSMERYLQITKLIDVMEGKADMNPKSISDFFKSGKQVGDYFK